MSAKSILWITAASAALVAVGCNSMMSTPDARQAATPPSTAPSTAPATAPAARAPRGEAPEGGARPARGGEGAAMAGGEARGPATAPAARGGRGPAAAPANLENAMGDMNRMLTALKAEATDPTKAEQTLRDLGTLERDVAISKLLTPPSVNRLAADKKAEAIESYRLIMTGLMRTLLDIEDAVDAKKPDDIKKGIAQLEDIEKHGHEEFNVKPGGD